MREREQSPLEAKRDVLTTRIAQRQGLYSAIGTGLIKSRDANGQLIVENAARIGRIKEHVDEQIKFDKNRLDQINAQVRAQEHLNRIY